MGEWNIKSEIDKGAFGIIYEVQSDSGIKAALKELLTNSNTNLSRFETEIKILESYDHKHIIKILNSNIKGISPFFRPGYVMEFMGGGSLKNKNDEIFRKGELWSLKWALQKVIFPVLDAIQYAHSHKTNPSFHRDLKPANLLFTVQDNIKVADWGIGKDINRESIALTVGGMGTQGYCSPEQWNWFPKSNITVDGRTDIYSLGIIFYEMMTGIIPRVFNFNTGFITVSPAPPSQYNSNISKDLDNCILKMMAYYLESRYQNIQEVIDALKPIFNRL